MDDWRTYKGGVMTLVEQIKAIYPDLTDDDFVNYIIVRDNSDGNGPYLYKWGHPFLSEPTYQQLNGLQS